MSSRGENSVIVQSSFNDGHHNYVLKNVSSVTNLCSDVVWKVSSVEMLIMSAVV